MSVVSIIFNVHLRKQACIWRQLLPHVAMSLSPLGGGASAAGKARFTSLQAEVTQVNHCRGQYHTIVRWLDRSIMDGLGAHCALRASAAAQEANAGLGPAAAAAATWGPPAAARAGKSSVAPLLLPADPRSALNCLAVVLPPAPGAPAGGGVQPASSPLLRAGWLGV